MATEQAGKDGPSWSPVITTLVIAGAQAIVFYSLFECWRKKEANRPHFEARQISVSHRAPPAAPGGWFKWFGHSRSISDEETLRCVGLDTFMFLRFLRMCFKMTFYSAIFAVVILIPVYATGNNPDPASTGYNTITMSNVEDSNSRLWAPLIFWYVFIACVLFTIWQEWKAYMPLRQKWLAQGDVDTNMEYRYTLLVENVPLTQRSTGSLFSFFARLFPGQVVKANLCLETEELEDTLKELEKAVIAYEKADAAEKGGAKKPPMKSTSKIPCVGKKVRATEYWEGEIRRLNDKANGQHAEIVGFGDELAEHDVRHLDKNPVKGLLSKVGIKKNSDPSFSERWQKMASSTGFVTFKSLAAKNEADQVELTGELNVNDTFLAPEPRDMLWENATVPLQQQQSKRKMANALWCLGILFWAIPVTFTQAIANLEGIREKAPWLWVPPKGSVAYGIISGYLPVLLLALLMILLPIMIGLSASKFARMKSQTAVDTYVFKWHFGFQVANLWLILIGGSIINQLTPLINDPASTVSILASAVPGASQFFLNLVINATFAGLFLELSGLVPVLIGWVKRKIKPDAKRSQRELDGAAEANKYKWGWVYPKIIFFTMVGFVYVIIVPILQPFVALYFFLAYTIHKHQALHVYSQPVEGGAAYYPLLYSFYMGTLYIALIVVLVYFGIKKAAAQTPLAVVPLIVTVFFDYYIRTHYLRFTRVLPLSKAREIDEATPVHARPEPISDKQMHTIDLAGRDETKEGGTLGGEVVKASGGFATLVESQEYAQPALRKSQWETQPMPYRRGSGKHQHSNKGGDAANANKMDQDIEQQGPAM